MTDPTIAGDVAIRPARRDDLPTLVALLADDDLGRVREDPDGDLAEYRAAFRAIEADDNHLLAVVDDDGPVAMLHVSFLPSLTFRGGWRAHVEGVRVASHRRGDGLGRTLLEWVADRARERGCHVVQLTTNATRAEAVRFYESLGYRPSHVGMKLYLEGDVAGR